MSQDITKIFAGPARVFTGITNPVTGTPPTLMGHTAGVPATGTEVGFTQGDATFTGGPVLKLIDAEQSLASVDVITIDEEVMLAFQMLEHNFNALKLSFNNIGNVDDVNKTLFYMGNGTSVLSPTAQGVMLSGIQRNAPTKFEIAVLYKAVNMKSTTIGYSKAKEAINQVELHALADISRNAGDQVMQWFREK